MLLQGLVQDIIWDEVLRCYRITIHSYDMQRSKYHTLPNVHRWTDLKQVYVANSLNNIQSSVASEDQQFKAVDEELQQALFRKKQTLLLASL